MMTAIIKEYPEFTVITEKCEEQIKKFTGQHEPYSDFNFISLFCWNTDNSASATFLNGNLVIKLPHYVKAHPVCSVLGTNMVDETLNQLLGIIGKLELVPEIVINSISNRRLFKITEDRDNFDFVYYVEEHATLQGEKFKHKRKKYNRFINNFSEKVSVQEVDLRNPEVASRVVDIFQQWANHKGASADESIQELTAIKRLLEHAANFELVCLMLFIDSEPAGFTIHEILNKDHAICHFHKTIPAYANSDVYLTSVAAQDLFNRGCTYVNWEQDLGIEGLRQSKLSYNHAKFLKKYIVERA